MLQLPDKDETSISKRQLLARLDVAMGGRVAEEIIFGLDNITTGASSDLRQATRLAQAMVTKYGFRDKVGQMSLEVCFGAVFLFKPTHRLGHPENHLFVLFIVNVHRMNVSQNVLLNFENKITGKEPALEFSPANSLDCSYATN